LGGGGKSIKGAGHIEGPSLFSSSPDADFSDDMLRGDACSTLPGLIATPISTGSIDFLQKLLLFSSGAGEA